MNGLHDRPVPATLSQQQLWFIDEFHHGLPAHNVPSQITAAAARLTWPRSGGRSTALVARHEALRTRLPAGTDGRPVQVIDPPGPVKLRASADLTGLASRRRGATGSASSRPPSRRGRSSWRPHWPVAGEPGAPQPTRARAGARGAPGGLRRRRRAACCWRPRRAVRRRGGRASQLACRAAGARSPTTRWRAGPAQAGAGG